MAGEEAERIGEPSMSLIYLFLAPIAIGMGALIIRPSSRMLRGGPLQRFRSSLALVLLFAGAGILWLNSMQSGIPSRTSILSAAIIFGGIGLIFGGAIDLFRFFRSKRET